MFNTDTNHKASDTPWTGMMLLVATALVIFGLVLPIVVPWSLDRALSSSHLTGQPASASLQHQAQMQCLTYSENPVAC